MAQQRTTTEFCEKVSRHFRIYKSYPRQEFWYIDFKADLLRSGAVSELELGALEDSLHENLTKSNAP